MPSKPLADHPVFDQIDIEKIAKDTHFVQRKSKKLDPSCFIQALLEAVISGNSSLSQLANSLGQMIGRSMSKQGMQKRFTDASSDFLLQIFSTLVARNIVVKTSRLKRVPFMRLLLQDTSFNWLHGGNSEFFSAHGNGQVDTAGFKIDLAYDLVNSELEMNTIWEATEQDKSIGKDLIDQVRPLDLVVRDMGYFVLDEFARIESVGAFWLSRLTAQTGVKVVEGNKEDSLENVLRKVNKSKKSIDIKVNMGNAKHPCRLIGVRASKEATKKAREERIRRSKLSLPELKKTAGWLRDGWHILVTNITTEESSKTDLMKIYRMRWDIEIQFRAWKQSLKLNHAFNKKTSPHHMYALIMASLIHLALMMIARAFTQAQLKRGELSIEKLAKSLSQFIMKAKRFEECWTYVADKRHVRKDSRKRNKPVIEAYELLG